MNDDTMLSAIADFFEGLSNLNEQRERQRVSGDDGNLSVPQTLPRLSLIKWIQLISGAVTLIVANAFFALISLGLLVEALLASRNFTQSSVYFVEALLLSSWSLFIGTFIPVAYWQLRGRTVRPHYGVWIYQTLALLCIGLMAFLLIHASADQNIALVQRLLYVCVGLGSGRIAWWPIRTLMTYHRQRIRATHH